MKELSFENMENIEGGDYCAMLYFWLNGGAGYQGDYSWLLATYNLNCAPVQQ